MIGLIISSWNPHEIRVHQTQVHVAIRNEAISIDHFMGLYNNLFPYLGSYVASLAQSFHEDGTDYEENCNISQKQSSK